MGFFWFVTRAPRPYHYCPNTLEKMMGNFMGESDCEGKKIQPFSIFNEDLNFILSGH